MKHINLSVKVDKPIVKVNEKITISGSAKLWHNSTDWNYLTNNSFNIFIDGKAQIKALLVWYDTIGAGNTPNKTLIQADMNKTGYAYDTWSLNSKGTPTISDLKKYDVVMWFGGSKWHPINQNQANLLWTYTKEGGSVWLEGGEYGYTARLNDWLCSEIWNKTFRVANWRDDVGNQTIQLIPHPASSIIPDDFYATGPSLDGYSQVLGNYTEKVLIWSEETIYNISAIAYDGVADPSCIGCGRIFYFAGVFADEKGYGIPSRARIGLLRGAVGWLAKASSDNYGNYSYTISAPSAAGIYSIKVNFTDKYGIEGGDIITLDVRSSICGDNICGAGETCGNCPQDCGICPTPPPPPVDYATTTTTLVQPKYVYDFSVKLPAAIDLFTNESKEDELIVENIANGTLTNLKVKVSSEPYCCVISITPESVAFLGPKNLTKFLITIPSGTTVGNYRLIFNVSSDEIWKENTILLTIKEIQRLVDISDPLSKRLTDLFELVNEKAKEGYDVSRVSEILIVAKSACDAKDYEKCSSLLDEADELMKKIGKPFPSLMPFPILIVVVAIAIGCSITVAMISKGKISTTPTIPTPKVELYKKIRSAKLELEKVEERGIDIADALEELKLAENAARHELENVARLHLENVSELIRKKLRS